MPIKDQVSFGLQLQTTVATILLNKISQSSTHNL